MIVTVIFEKGDLDPLHDIVFDLTDKQLNNSELQVIWDDLPGNLKDEAIHWGLNDSVVRDNIYVHLREFYGK